MSRPPNVAPNTIGQDAAPAGLRSITTIGVAELVLIVASLWALNAFAIDMMLPALGTIGSDLHLTNPNDRQLLIIVYIIFNGIAQLFFGPIVDRFGRRSVLLWAIVIYTIASFFCLFAPTFVSMLFARSFQGIATAGTRVAALAIIRDRFSGRAMAQVMSLVMTVFMAAPIVAPGIGQMILFFGPWRWIFFALMVYGLGLGIWIFLRIAETLPSEKARPISLKSITTNYRFFFNNRISVGYAIGNALVFGSLFAFISASEQIFLEIFELGNLFALAFAAIAFPLGLATVINSKLVKEFGMRKISHTALIGLVVTTIVHFGFHLSGIGNIYTFLGFMCIAFFALGLIGPNFTAIAMEPMGEIAGSAGAANGFASTTLSGIIGGMIARAYDGTIGPILVGMLLLSCLSFFVTAWTEKGKLFEPYADRQDDSI